MKATNHPIKDCTPIIVSPCEDYYTLTWGEHYLSGLSLVEALDEVNAILTA